jgi:hypothetical protein
VRHRELVAAVSELEPIRVQGLYERHTSLRWGELKPSAAGGRWGARGAFEAVYLGRPRESIVVEAYRHLVDDELDDAPGLAASVLERRVVTCEIDVPHILDLRPDAARAAVGLTDDDVYSEVGDWAPCQAVGAAAHQLNLAGLIAPAATRLGETLALYPTNLAIEYWPEVVAREVWHGLPADPRRLRLADDKSS